MGCASSSYLEDEAGNATPGLGRHIVSLTSTTYGLLSTLDPPFPHQTQPPPPTPLPPPTPPAPPLTAIPSAATSLPRHRLEPETINSWELMAGLDTLTPPKPAKPVPHTPGKENASRALHFFNLAKDNGCILCHYNTASLPRFISLDMFERRCPPGGEKAVVFYSTTLRGIRKTFEQCNAVRAALDGLGVWVRERDVSMDLGFREELRGLMGGSVSVPRVFVRGRYIGGVEQVLQMHEEGLIRFLVEGLPKAPHGGECDGCGGARFLPCFRCSGSRKLVISPAADEAKKGDCAPTKAKVVRCPDCNENGLAFCPICSEF